MAMKESMEILLSTEDRPEVERITDLVKRMDSSEQSKMLIFIQGIKFAESFMASDKGVEA